MALDTETLNLLLDAVRRFVHERLIPAEDELAASGQVPPDIVNEMRDLGLFGLSISPDFGGLGLTMEEEVRVVFELGQTSPAFRSLAGTNIGIGSQAIVLAGTDEQRANYLPKLASGELIGSFALTEPDAGSAVTELKTSATRADGGWRINGTKIFTTHGPHASVILAYVRFGPGTGGIGSVLIGTRDEGVKLGKRSAFMSGEEWVEIFFDNVFVPDDMVVLGEGGFKKQIAGFNVERIGNTARSLALGRYAYEEARNWAMQRKQFGRLLCEFQGLQWKFADMRIKLDAAQLLLYRAATGADTGFPSATETAIAKAYCNQVGFDVANDALQVLGGLGYSRESLVEYCVRRCRGWMIAGGSIEILKNRIAEGVFERSFPQRPPR